MLLKYIIIWFGSRKKYGKQWQERDFQHLNSQKLRAEIQP
jgi:hypothetical protein